jgi:plasmid stabilization system protein ParE
MRGSTEQERKPRDASGERVGWSNRAVSDYGAIIDDMAEDNPAAAQRVSGRIDECVQTLVGAPMGRQGRVSGTYEKVVPGLPYIIAYLLGDEWKGHETIAIVRVIHGAREGPEERGPE